MANSISYPGDDEKKSECCNASVNAVWDAPTAKVFYDCTNCGNACTIRGE